MLALESPAIQNSNFTVKDEYLEEISSFTTVNIQILSDLLTTFQRQESGIKLFYGLDFDLIYSYAEPWASNSLFAKLVKFVIENDNTCFVLLPGTVEELWDYLDRVTKNRENNRKLINRLKENNPSDRTVECAKSLARTSSLGENGKSLDCDLNLLAKELCNLEEMYSKSIANIESLLHYDHLRKLGDLFDDSNIQIYEDDVYNDIFIRLTSQRITYDRGSGLKRKKNEADAKNLATLIQHAKYESNKFKNSQLKSDPKQLRLLTNTNRLLNFDLREYNDNLYGEIAHTPKDVVAGIKHSFAVRSIFEAAFATAMMAYNNNNVSASRKMTSERINLLNVINVAINAIDNQKRNEKFHVSSQVNVFSDVMNNFDAMIKENFILDPWHGFVRSLLFDVGAEYGLKLQFDCSDSSEYWWREKCGRNDTDIILDEKSIPLHTYENISKLGKAIEDRIIIADTNRDILALLGIQSRNIELIGENAPSRWVVEKQKKEFLFLFDIFNQKYYMTWPTIIQLEEILKRIVDIDESMKKSNLPEYKGQIFLEIGEDSDLIPVKTLPLKFDTTFKDLLNDITKSGKIPSRIIYSTDLVTIDFDVWNIDEDQKILVVFSNKTLNGYVIELFKKTSKMKSDAEYFKQLSSLIHKNTHERIFNSGK